MHATTPLLLFTLGLILGTRHALEPDHLAAVSTLLAGGRRNGAALIGGLWGLGHTASILALGGLLLVFRLQLPERTQALLEMAVALMLIGLGAGGLWRGFRLSQLAGGASHQHAGVNHRHPGDSTHWHVGPLMVGARPLIVGTVHGLAGTGALTALVMSQLPSLGSALGYLASFGLGSVLGMALLTFAAEWPLRRLTSARGQSWLAGCTGCLSFGFGAYWASQQLPRL